MGRARALVSPHDVTGAPTYEQRIGACGLDRTAFDAALDRTAPALAALAESRSTIPFLAVADRGGDLDDIDAAAHRHREAFDSVVVLGTGGSSLGGRALTALAQPAFGGSAVGDRIYFMENVDPASFAALFRALDLRRTGFIAISKSCGVNFCAWNRPLRVSS